MKAERAASSERENSKTHKERVAAPLEPRRADAPQARREAVGGAYVVGAPLDRTRNGTVHVSTR
jgi:hypothetical protein